ncbi:hypothetical protein ACMBCN_01315 [Candidatus Liberibacter asiaticus]
MENLSNPNSKKKKKKKKKKKIFTVIQSILESEFDEDRIKRR